MPLYLVRWPDLTGSIVRADNREELDMILDELADPGLAQVWRYDGPLFLDLSLPLDRPVSLKPGPQSTSDALKADEIEIGDVEPIARLEGPKITIAPTDTGMETTMAIMALAFPHLYEALHSDTAEFDEDEERVDPQTVREALRKEAMTLVEASWRHAAALGSDDGRYMGASEEVAGTFLDLENPKPSGDED